MKFKITAFIKDAIDKITLPKNLYIIPIYKLIHLINIKTSTQIIPSDYVNIHSKDLAKLFGKNKVKKYINLLLENNIIEVEINPNTGKQTYLNDHRAKGYRISPTLFLNKTFDDLSIYSNVTIKDETFKKDIKKKFKRPTTRELRYIYDILKSKTFIVDIKSAYNWIKTELLNGEITLVKAVHYKGQIDNLHKKLIYCKKAKIKTDNDGNILEDNDRIYHNFILLKSELRQFCSINGDRLVGIDLKSSQPYILASLLVLEQPTNKGFIKFYDAVTKHDIYSYLIIINKLKLLNKTPKEYRRIIKDQFMRLFFSSNKGQLYYSPDKNITEIIDNMRVLPGMSKEEVIKINRNKVLFTKERLFWLKDGLLVDFKYEFERTFQEVYEYIQKYKTKQIRKNPNSKGHLALKLTKIESSLFLPVIKSLNKDNSSNDYKIYAISGHDAIYTTENNADWVLSDLKIHFENKGYINAKFNIEK